MEIQERSLPIVYKRARARSLFNLWIKKFITSDGLLEFQKHVRISVDYRDSRKSDQMAADWMTAATLNHRPTFIPLGGCKRSHDTLPFLPDIFETMLTQMSDYMLGEVTKYLYAACLQMPGICLEFKT